METENKESLKIITCHLTKQKTTKKLLVHSITMLNYYCIIFLLLTQLSCPQFVTSTNNEVVESSSNGGFSNSSRSYDNIDDIIERKRKADIDIIQQQNIIVDQVVSGMNSSNQTIDENHNETDTATTATSLNNNDEEEDDISTAFEMWMKEVHNEQSEMERILLMGYGSIMPQQPPSPQTNRPIPQPIPLPPAIIPTTQTPSRNGNDTTLVPTPISLSCLSANQTVESYILERLSMITNKTILLNPITPQGLAYNFTLNDPIIQNNICTYPTLEQRYSLVVIYYSTSGTNWFLSEGWLQPLEECSWLGVSCTNDIYVSAIDLGMYNIYACTKLTFDKTFL